MVLRICPRCKIWFDKKSNYHAHMNRKNPCAISVFQPEDKDLTCPSPCAISVFQPEDKDLTCPSCQKVFSTKSNTRRHIKVCPQKKIVKIKEELVLNMRKELKLSIKEILQTYPNTVPINDNSTSNCNVNDNSTSNCDVDDIPLPNKSSTKNKISGTIRCQVWERYIENFDGKQASCWCCGYQKISPFRFHCGHVISKAKGGENTIDNLRPICDLCNTSMGVQNMLDFIQEHGYRESPIITNHFCDEQLDE